MSRVVDIRNNALNRSQGSRGPTGPMGPIGPTGSSGNGSGFTGTFLDTEFTILNNNTSQLKFDLSNMSTGTEQLILIPNSTIGTTVSIPNISSYSVGTTRSYNGAQNTTFGFRCAASLTTGTNNTMFGADSLRFCITGSQNSAFGHRSLMNATGTTGNNSFGALSMFSSTGNDICAFGIGTGRLAWDRTCAFGNYSLNNSTQGTNNAFGYGSLRNLSVGTGNCAFGINAGSSLTAGDNNVILGGTNFSIPGGTLNTSIIIGANNEYVQNNSNLILIGSSLNFGNTSNVIRIGAPNGNAGTFTHNFQSGIRGVTTDQPNAIPVLIDSNGQLGTISSSITKKTNVVDMHDTSDILKLRPVNFYWKSDVIEGTERSPHLNYGLIAEEVNEIFPALTIRNSQGEIETVAYHLLPVMLLNEMKKLHAEIKLLKERYTD